MNLSFLKNKKFLIFAGITLALIVIIIIAAVLLNTSQTEQSQKETDSSTDVAQQSASTTPDASTTDNTDSTSDTVGNASEPENEVGQLVPSVDESSSIEGVDNDTEKLMLHTPVYANDFSVVFNYSDKSFIITLFAIYNYEWQREQYLKDLASYKEEALLWIESNDVDLSQIKIQYIPEEAEDL